MPIQTPIRSYGEPQVDLNFFEILVPNEAPIMCFPYTDKDELKRLREENPDHFFHRDRNNILSWALKENPTPLKTQGNTSWINFPEYNYAFAKIVQTGLEQFLVSKGLKLSRTKSFSPEFIREKNLTDIPGIALYQKMILETEVLRFGRDAKLGFLIDFGLKVDFTYSIDEMMKKGIDPRGMLVKTTDGDFGKIISVNNSTLNLDSGETIEASEAMPIATRESQLHYLSSLGKVDEFQKIIDKESTALAVYKKIQNIYEYLKKNKDQIYFGAGLTLQDVLNFAVSGTSGGLKKDILFRPVHYYGNNRIESHKYPSRDLPELGTFSNLAKQINILVLSPAEHKGNVELFLKKFSSNLQGLFGFEKIMIDDKYFEKATTPLKGFESLIYKDDMKLSDYDAALILISEDYKHLPINENPYYVIKATLMGDKIPSQEVEIETIKQMNRINEPFILNNISLAIYGKIGGTPWAIEKLDPLRKEFIVGIGSSTIKDVSGESKKIIAFATVFDFTGKYVVGECSTTATSEDYKIVLRDYLITLISDLIKKENISTDKDIRLIFHLFKPAGKYNEIWAIDEALKQFSTYKIETAILHLNDGHNFKAFADKGATLPNRGLLIEISDDRKLLCFASQKMHKDLKGNPTPLMVELDRRSTFKDLNYLIKQVFYFSFLSCRSFIPSRTPITILYPSLLAFLAGTLKEIPGWNYKKLEVVRERLWFI